MAQWKRAGLITLMSPDRNRAALFFFSCTNFFGHDRIRGHVASSLSCSFLVKMVWLYLQWALAHLDPSHPLKSVEAFAEYTQSSLVFSFRLNSLVSNTNRSGIANAQTEASEPKVRQEKHSNSRKAPGRSKENRVSSF